MSYNHSLLFASIYKRLHESPQSSVGHVSRELGVSYRTVQQVVYGETGKTFRTLREEILMVRVRQLFISQPGLAIKEVSFALGFCSSRSFGRAVKRACGFSPEDLRSSLAHRRFAKEEVDALATMT
jgi:AraC-like DNA-binding protein